MSLLDMVTPPTLEVVPSYSGKPPEATIGESTEHSDTQSYFLSWEKWVEPPVTVSEDKTEGIFQFGLELSRETLVCHEKKPNTEINQFQSETKKKKKKKKTGTLLTCDWSAAPTCS